MKKLILILSLFPLISISQVTQTIRGVVYDSESRMPLIGANVILLSDSGDFIGATTDINGIYKLDRVPIGRRSVKCSFIGYEPNFSNGIIVSSGKEVILDFSLMESMTQMAEVVVEASGRKGEVMNEMSTVSARGFTVEETERYSGSRGDPARMASNFAGCQGSDDSRNDIVIRGNSPLGVIYRMEGVQMPNPNHFSISGSSGGPVSILNNKFLANSDFYTGAFPAEFGNSTAGVFDIKLRNGNNEKNEFTGQFGFLGTELTAEGPINKEKRSSYLAGYRYSTLSMFQFMGIDVGTSAIPKYSDATFKMNFPTKNNGNLSVFGIGGQSDIDILVSNQTKPERELYGDTDRDQYFGTSMGIVGATYTKSINKDLYGKATLALTGEEQHVHHELVYRHVSTDSTWIVDSLVHKQDYNFRQSNLQFGGFLNKKFGVKHTVKAGVNLDGIQYSYVDSQYNDTLYTFFSRWNSTGNALLAQPYIQWKWRINGQLTLNSGLHAQYFSMYNQISPVEPRLGLKWELAENQSLSMGFGYHTQIQPLYVHFYKIPGNPEPHNKNLKFSSSIHYVLGYDVVCGNNLRIKAETYYQQLFNIPVETNPSSFSLVNMGSGFDRMFPDTLVNEGTGENYGVELTVEKFFSNKFFFLMTGSFYNAHYKGSDGVSRNTDFNGNYVVNGLAAREFSLGEKNTLTIGTKITRAGNKRTSPVDTLATLVLQEIVFVDSLRNSQQFPDYFRVDFTVKARLNGKKVSHELGLDIINALGIENILKQSYIQPFNPGDDFIRKEYQLGRLPIFYYRCDF